MTKQLAVLFALIIISILPSNASDLVRISALTDRILLLKFDDGYVDHYTLNELKSDEKLVVDPLIVAEAMLPGNYLISSENDPDFGTGIQPDSIGRKSKGKDFSANWGEGNPWVMEHNIYLFLPHPLKNGNSYTLNLNNINASLNDTVFSYLYTDLFSESIHVNQVGYSSDAPVKYAYLSHWMGDKGPLDFENYSDKSFYLIDVNSGETVFQGSIEKRKDLETGGIEGSSEGSTPYGSFCGADVWVCDFSAYTVPGQYRISVQDIGCSFPFSMGKDVFREAYRTVSRALYHQRCGVAIEEEYTEWTRERCHHPDDCPEVELSNWRYMDKRNAFTELPENATGVHRPYFGGWHDAADWDRRTEHIEGIRLLLLAFELKPFNFNDGELNIPESGNGIPDILDQANWGLEVFRLMQEENGGIHGGIETSGHPEEYVTSVTDKDQWYAYAVDPVVTYSYSGTAAQLALCYEKIGQQDLYKRYLASAISAYNYAFSHTPLGDWGIESVKENRQFAAAALFRITGDEKYLDQFIKDNIVSSPNTSLYAFNWGTWMMALDEKTPESLKNEMREVSIQWAQTIHTDCADKRGYRFGSQWSMPTGWGNATKPDLAAVFVAYALTGDPGILSYAYTTADYTLGANPLNMCWVSGLGSRYPKEIMHLDSKYYHSDKGVVPGLIPFGPSKYANDPDAGHWLEGYAQKTTYPNASQWPSHELYCEDRYIPKTNEFTVHSSLMPAMLAYGFLSESDYSDPSRMAISGKTEVKLYEDGLVFKLDSIPGASYRWIVPNGVTINKGEFGRMLNANWGCGNDTIAVEMVYEDSIYTFRKAITIKPYSIEGPLWVADNSEGIAYSINEEVQGTITWNSGYGIEITEGQNTSRASFEFTRAGNIYLEIETECSKIYDTMYVEFGDGQYAFPDSVPHLIPGTIHATEFDYGGEGVAYHDKDTINEGNGSRPTEGVDTRLETEFEYISNIESGEWLEYSVYFPKDTVYNLHLLIASPNDEGLFHLLINNGLYEDNIQVLNTGSSELFDTLHLDSMNFKEGMKIIQFLVVKGGFSIGDIEIDYFKEEANPLDTTFIIRIPESEIRIFPNPMHNKLHIQYDHAKTEIRRLKIYNLLGELLLNIDPGTITGFDLSHLKPGSYIVILEGSAGLSYKGVIQKL